MAEKNRVAEEEAMLLSRKASEVEHEISRMRLNALKTEEEKVQLERKSREAETLTFRLVEESKKRATEAERLKNELIHARVAEKEAKEKLLTFLSRTTIAASPPPPQMIHQTIPLISLPNQTVQLLNAGNNFLSISSQSLNDSTNSTAALYEDTELHSYDMMENGDISELSLEIEKERVEYIAKSKQVQSQLKDLRSEIEMLKICETEFDRQFDEQMRLGENKYSTLKKAIKSSTKHKVAFYEEL